MDSITIWTYSLIAGAVVILIVAALLIAIVTARKIDGLAGRTLTAAGGIAGNTSALKNLTATNEVVAALVANTTPIVAVADAIDKKLSLVSAFFGGGKK
ncbi:MAG: hypothetical protein H0W58_18620 [Acidobacteria bacterium]|jgi:hypothetical protein|nr:hypothetical protein [Acidobacteriota bacterium]